MALIASAKKSGGNFDIIKEGVYVAVCYGVYDLGSHWNEKYEKDNRLIRILWEIPEERIDIEIDGKTQNLPRVISKEYTLSLNEKANLRKHLECWRGKAFTEKELDAFDVGNLVSKSCQLQVVHWVDAKGDKHASISTIMALPKGVKPLVPENPIVCFSLSENTPIPESTPKWLADKIMDSSEWKMRTSTATSTHTKTTEPTNSLDDEFDADEIPF